MFPRRFKAIPNNISNSISGYMKKYNIVRSGGYTLIELLIVMMLLIVTGTVVVGILNATYRGTSKSKITSDIAQNGNYALSTISNVLTNSRQLISFTPTNSASITDCVNTPPAGQSLTVLGFDGGTTTFTCNENELTISSSSAIFSALPPTPTPYKITQLIDTSRVKLAPATCSFTCTQQDIYSPPRIDVRFQLVNSAGTASDKTGAASFNTSVSLRNQSY